MNNKDATRRQSKDCSFFFVKPKERSDANVVAKQLMGLQGIEEVLITEGDYGFVVKTSSSGHESMIQGQLVKRFGKQVRQAKSYYQYRK